MIDTGTDARVAALFARRRRELEVALPELARRSGVDRSRLQRLLAGGGPHFRLDELVRLSRALDVPRADVIGLLWPGPHVGAGSVREPEPALPGGPRAPFAWPPDAAPEQVPTVRLVRGLTLSGRWSFSLARVYGGPSADVQVPLFTQVAALPSPPDVPVTDDLTLRRRVLEDLGGLPAGVAFAVWRDRHSPAGHFPHDPEGGHPATGTAALHLQSAVYAADRPVGPSPARLRGAAADGVVVLALRVHAYSLRISATVARALGWGFTSTARSSNRVAPGTVAEPRERARSGNRYANLALGEYLAAPLPATVLSHVGTPVTDDDGTVLEPHALLTADPRTGPFVVVLHESDAMLAAGLQRPVNAQGGRSRLTLDQLRGWRDDLVARGTQLQAAGRGLVVPVPDGWVHADLDAAAEDVARWRDHVRVARAIVLDLLHLSQIRTGFAVRDPMARALLAYESPVPWF